MKGNLSLTDTASIYLLNGSHFLSIDPQSGRFESMLLESISEQTLWLVC